MHKWTLQYVGLHLKPTHNSLFPLIRTEKAISCLYLVISLHFEGAHLTGRVNTENREAVRAALVRYAGALALRLAGKKIVGKTCLSLVPYPMRYLQISDGYNNLAGPLGRGI